MVSKVRVKLLQTFLAQPDEMFYVRQLVRATDEEINAVRRELLRMEKGGLVKKEARGNRLYYWFNKKHLLYGDLLSLVAKTIGLGAQIIQKKAKIGQIKFAMLSGRYPRRLPTQKDGVDLLIVGQVAMPVLTKIVTGQEKEAGREINYSVMTRKEFDFRKKRRDPFLLGILQGSRVMLIGDEEEMVD